VPGRGRQSWRPEVIQPKLIPQMAGQPAGAPLPRPVQPRSAEPDMHHIAIQNWRRAVLGEQRDLPRVLASLVERFDRSAPRGFLAVIGSAAAESRGMFLRYKVRRKDGKEHRYWSIVENRRVSGGRTVQRQVLYLGEIGSAPS